MRQESNDLDLERHATEVGGRGCQGALFLSKPGFWGVQHNSSEGSPQWGGELGVGHEVM